MNYHKLSYICLERFKNLIRLIFCRLKYWKQDKKITSLLKKNSRVIRTVLASYFTTHTVKWTFFFSRPMPWQAVILLFLVRINFQHFILCSVTWRLFASVTSSGTLLPISSQHYLIYVSKFALTKFWWLQISNLLNGRNSVTNPSSCFFYHVSYISFESHFQLYNFIFLGCPFIFTGHFSLSIIRFCKIHHDYHGETGDNTKANLVSGCVQMDRLLKEMVQLITTKAHLIFIWWLVH